MEEVIQTIEKLQQTFEDLAVRGLRSCGPENLTVLTALHEELDRVGAAHMAGRLEDVILKIQSDDRGAAASLMKAQASLRVFERLLTLDVVAGALESLQAQLDDDDDDEDEDEDDDDDEDEDEDDNEAQQS